MLPANQPDTSILVETGHFYFGCTTFFKVFDTSIGFCYTYASFLRNAMKTFIPTEKDFNRKTYWVNASGKTLGRLATRVASVLIGKGKPCFTKDQISGDQVVVVNAREIYVTGRKAKQKIYKHYTGYPGGLRTYSFEELRDKNPEEIIKRAVSRMLPKNKLGREMLRRLRIYGGPNHAQQAQQPVPLEF